jgi:small subunit ribosomal protein S1
VHISELAAHHVENPREIVQPGDDVRVKILEIDSERRRLSLSVKRVEGQVLPLRTPTETELATEEDPVGGEAGDLDDLPSLGLSEDVFAEQAPVDAEQAGEAAGPDEPTGFVDAAQSDEAAEPGDAAEPDEIALAEDAAVEAPEQPDQQ